MKSLLKLPGLLFMVLLLIVVGRTLWIPSKQIAPIAHTPEAIDADKTARDLSGAIQFPTISWEEGGTPEQKSATLEAFQGLHAYLEKAFPRVYTNLQHEVVGANNLLLTWKGSDASLKPMLLMGHQDVVPVEADTERNWTHAPFAGDIADGYIWGRGTLDDKMTVVGLLEAVDTLLAKGFHPKRTIYLAFGQDEEVGGQEGAEKIAQLLKSRGVQLEFVSDEGGFISLGMVPGVTAPVAMIGTSEKGYLSLELTVETVGGHSSVPGKDSSIGILSAAIQKIEANPMPAHIHGPIGEFLEYAGGNASFPMRVVFKNMWLFGPVVQRILEASPNTNATLRTTAAATIFQAGTKDNVMPSRARAVVNFRLLPGDTIASVTEHMRKVVDDPRVKMQPLAGEPPVEASAQSSVESPNFKRMQETLAQVYPEAVVAPFVFVGATDSRHYGALTKDIYRFAPMVLNAEDIKRIHGTNERIGVANFARSIDFLCQLIRNAAG
ncbi:MAG TPA: M20 family peptidase [Candidatus Acidoferrum sp.]|nr:M20 family peptidase [Candidatus Acidoferrum sp.]